MSRIGKNPVLIPEGVKIKITGNNINVEGPKGVQEWDSHPEIDISEVDGELHVERPSDSSSHKSLHGTTRQIINNMVLGVSDGFVKELEVIGIGYQALVKDNRLKLQVGYSHDIYFDVLERWKNKRELDTYYFNYGEICDFIIESINLSTFLKLTKM